MEIIDTHVHLNEIDNTNQVLERAKHSGVSGIVAVGVDYESNKKNLQLHTEFNNFYIYIAMGMHPSNYNVEPHAVLFPTRGIKQFAGVNGNTYSSPSCSRQTGELCDRLENFQSTIDFIKENTPNIVAIGEIGLDYWNKLVRKNTQEKNNQKMIFQTQLNLAKEFSLPAIIHSRGAWQDCFQMTKDTGIEKAVFHWYSGPTEILDKIIENGYLVSCTPALEYSRELRSVIEKTPLERILVETDSPVRYKSQPAYNAEPKDVLKTLSYLSSLKNISVEKAGEITTLNAKQFFRL